MKRLFGLALMLVSTTGFAAGVTAWAVPTRIDVMYEGIMVYGSFGNPEGCTVTNQFFVAINSGQYKEIYAALMMAIATGKEVSTYTSSCEPVAWYSGPSVTFNRMNNGGFINVRN